MDMSYKNRAKYPVMIKAVMDVVGRYPTVKGIIHCQSYVLGKQIMATKNKRLITHDSTNKQEMLRLFMESKDPLVFVTPSSVRGLSLNDDLARFGICPKMPFPNTQDKAISKRLYGSGRKGKLWYNSEAGQGVLQMSGRHIRSYADYGDMFILDQCFDRVRKTLPVWYAGEIIEDFDYGDDEDMDYGDDEAAAANETVVASETIDDDFDY
jgi:Rad3-related DNA helicase